MKYRRIVTIGIVALLLFIGIYLLNRDASNNTPPKPALEAQVTITQTPQIDLTINYGTQKPQETMNVKIVEDDTVLKTLEKSKSIETKTYSFGVSVESIEGIQSSADKGYWLYYVNGQQAQVGADQYKLKSGDKIEWKLEKAL